MLDLPFKPDASDPAPLYDQLAGCLRELIAAGRLEAGERLPPTRDLAQLLGLSRNTVNRAYEALSGAGFLEAQVGRGTFVAAGSVPVPEGPPAARPAIAWPTVLARRARRFETPLLPPSPSEVRIDLRPGRVDPKVLPVAELQRAYQRAVAQLPECANELDFLGWPALRHALAKRLAGRGIRCDPDEVLVVSGAQQALDLVARVIVDSGDSVALEHPGYFGATLAFRAAGADLLGIGVDSEGLRVGDLARAVRRRRLACVYTTPAVQLPTGVALSAARRDALLDLAAREQIPVLEDDFDAELRAEGATAALKQRDPGELVLYLGTFSKSLFPGLRIGYLLAPAALRASMVTARVTASMQPALVDQIALAELLRTDTLDRHIRRMRRHYNERRDALLGGLARELPEEIVATPPAGGNAVWVPLPAGVDATRVLARASVEGVAAGFGATFCFEGPPLSALQLSCAVADPDQLAEGAAILGRAIREEASR